MEILSDNLWSRLEDIGEKSPFCRAAVAYISCTDYIGFKEGSLVIVNASNNAVSSGATSALVLEELFNNKVELYSNDTLHAKIIIFDKYIYLGSANISNNSKNNLIEVGVIFHYKDDAQTFEKFQNILISIQKDERTKLISKEDIDELKRIPIHSKKVIKRNKFKNQNSLKRYWALGIFKKDYHGNDQRIEDEKEQILEESEDIDFFFFKERHSSSIFHGCHANDVVVLFSRNGSRDPVDNVYLVSILHTFIDENNEKVCFYKILEEISVKDDIDFLNNELSSLYKVKWIGRELKSNEINNIKNILDN